MKLGPFNSTDVNGITELLESKRIEYSMEIDEQARAEIMAKYHDHARYNPREMAGTLDLKIIYFEIADSDFEKVKTQLENYGIVPLSDGSFELGED